MNANTDSPLLGCVADDVTGATDLANNLVLSGMRVIQFFGVPSPEQLQDNACDAVVVALKTRSINADDASAQSVEAIEALRNAGCRRYFFKYCSTFDSTKSGNIGPVAEALMDALGVQQTVFCPAFPRAGRTVYCGHLFVNGKLLNESGMEHHPLNPMKDANLVRVLSEQSTRSVGLLAYESLSTVNRVNETLESLRNDGKEMIVTDGCDDEHLRTIANVVFELPLVTGGSGIARHLPEAYRRNSLLASRHAAPSLPDIPGRSLILSGSCSNATNRQVALASPECCAFSIDVLAVVNDFETEQSKLLDWARRCDGDRPMLVYSTALPKQVHEIQKHLGSERAAAAVEDFLGWTAKQLVNQLNVRRLIVAGGETSGAVVRALGIEAIRIGPEICAGVPWTESIGDRSIALALKSGNFGDDGFFKDALEMLP